MMVIIMRNRRFVAQLLILMYLFVSVIAVCDYLDRKNADEVNELNDVRYTHKCRIDKTDITYLPESRPEENETVLSFELYHCGDGGFPYSDPIEVLVDYPESDLDLAKPIIESLDIPFGDTSCMMYMDYRALTDTTSKQWELQQNAYTDWQGFRKIGDDYCVALGTYYGQIGDRFRISTDKGNCYSVIMSDAKGFDAVFYNDYQSWYHVCGDSRVNLIEFVVDTYSLDNYAQIMGDCGVLDNIGGNIVSVERID